MAEFQNSLWAPWRMQYVGAAPVADEGCFLCRYAAEPANDPANLVLWRSAQTLVLLNRFPYTNGHLLIAPVQHAAALEALPAEVRHELDDRITAATQTLRAALNAQGFNVGLNLGKVAGAGLPDHIHWHIVPRWAGDTNFMAVVSDCHVIPQALEAVMERFHAASRSLGLEPAS
jgi:ATP adenylyltransferase